jgi:hypothetical protein
MMKAVFLLALVAVARAQTCSSSTDSQTDFIELGKAVANCAGSAAEIAKCYANDPAAMAAMVTAMTDPDGAKPELEKFSGCICGHLRSYYVCYLDALSKTCIGGQFYTTMEQALEAQLDTFAKVGICPNVGEKINWSGTFCVPTDKTFKSIDDNNLRTVCDKVFNKFGVPTKECDSKPLTAAAGEGDCKGIQFTYKFKSYAPPPASNIVDETFDFTMTDADGNEQAVSAKASSVEKPNGSAFAAVLSAVAAVVALVFAL